jgi:hypothetical protein
MPAYQSTGGELKKKKKVNQVKMEEDKQRA